LFLFFVDVGAALVAPFLPKVKIIAKMFGGLKNKL